MVICHISIRTYIRGVLCMAITAEGFLMCGHFSGEAERTLAFWRGTAMTTTAPFFFNF